MWEWFQFWLFVRRDFQDEFFGMNFSEIFRWFFEFTTAISLIKLIWNFSRFFGYSGDEDCFLFPALPVPLILVINEKNRLKKGLEVTSKYCPARIGYPCSIAQVRLADNMHNPDICVGHIWPSPFRGRNVWRHDYFFRYNPGDSTMIVAGALQGLGKTI